MKIPQHIKQIILALGDLHPNVKVNVGTYVMWALALADVKPDLVQKAVTAHIRRSKWFPQPSEILDLAEQIEVQEWPDLPKPLRPFLPANPDHGANILRMALALAKGRTPADTEDARRAIGAYTKDWAPHIKAAKLTAPEMQDWLDRYEAARKARVRTVRQKPSDRIRPGSGPTPLTLPAGFTEKPEIEA